MSLKKSMLLFSILIGGCIPSETRTRIAEFTEEPVVEGSNIYLVAMEQLPGDMLRYTLSTGESISGTQVKYIREIASKFNVKKVQIAELLLNLYVKKDEMEHAYFVSPYDPWTKNGLWRKSGIWLYLGFKEADPYLRFRVEFHGQHWLFVESFKIAADDYRWQSPSYAFKRRAVGGVEEWIDIPATPNEVALARKLSQAEKAVVRFRGSEYNEDVELTPDQKDAIVKILRLFELMTSNLAKPKSDL